MQITFNTCIKNAAKAQLLLVVQQLHSGYHMSANWLNSHDHFGIDVLSVQLIRTSRHREAGRLSQVTQTLREGMGRGCSQG